MNISFDEEDIFFDFKFQFYLRLRNSISGDEYDDCYYKKMRSDIIRVKYDDTICDEIEEKIGFIEVWHIDGTRAYDNDLDVVDICDSVEQELYDYAESIYTNGWIDEKICPMPRSNDVLVLHRIEIDKKYRGKKYGLIISKMISNFLGYHCGAILLRPSPLQFSEISKKDGWQEKYDTSMFSEDREEATKKLKVYWKKLGLKKTKNKTIYCITQE